MTFEFRRREFLGGVAAVGLLGGCRVSESGAGAASAGDIAKKLEGIADGILGDFPEVATSLGIDKGARAPLAHRFYDRTPAGVETRNANASKRLAELEDIRPRRPDRPRQARRRGRARRAPDRGRGRCLPVRRPGHAQHRHRLSQHALCGEPDGRGVHRDPRLSRQQGDGAERATWRAAYADRVDAYARNLDGETERMAHDRGIGVVAPDFVLDKAIGIIGAGAAEDPAQIGGPDVVPEEAGRGQARPEDRRPGRGDDAREGPARASTPARGTEKAPRRRDPRCGRVAFQGRRRLLCLGAQGLDHDRPLARRDPPARPRAGQGDPGAHGNDPAEAGDHRRHGRRAHGGAGQAPRPAFPQHRRRAAAAARLSQRADRRRSGPNCRRRSPRWCRAISRSCACRRRSRPARRAAMPAAGTDRWVGSRALLHQPARHRGMAQVQPSDAHLSRGHSGPHLAGRIFEPRGADPLAAVVQRLFRGLGALRRAARGRARHVRRRSAGPARLSPVLELSRLPAGRRHRHARQALDPRAGDRLVRQDQRRRPRRRSLARSTAIAPGRARPAATRSGTSRSCGCATRRSRRWAANSTCAPSTMPWSRAAGCR